MKRLEIFMGAAPAVSSVNGSVRDELSIALEEAMKMMMPNEYVRVYISGIWRTEPYTHKAIRGKVYSIKKRAKIQKNFACRVDGSSTLVYCTSIHIPEQKDEEPANQDATRSA